MTLAQHSWDSIMPLVDYDDIEYQENLAEWREQQYADWCKKVEIADRTTGCRTRWYTEV